MSTLVRSFCIALVWLGVLGLCALLWFEFGKLLGMMR